MVNRLCWLLWVVVGMMLMFRLWIIGVVSWVRMLFGFRLRI